MKKLQVFRHQHLRRLNAKRAVQNHLAISRKGAGIKLLVHDVL